MFKIDIEFLIYFGNIQCYNVQLHVVQKPQSKKLPVLGEFYNIWIPEVRANRPIKLLVSHPYKLVNAVGPRWTTDWLSSDVNLSPTGLTYLPSVTKLR